MVDIIGDNNRVVVNFKDNGDGIDEEIIDKIWSPFFTTKERGTGLGLGIVKNIVEAHDGKIKITNRELRGVDVMITLPVNQGN